MGTRGKLFAVGPTIALAVSVLALVIVVVIISQNTRSDSPTTRGGVTAEVLAGVDSIAGALPAGTVTSSTDASVVSACPDRGGGEEVAVSRTMTIRPGFDRYAWIESLTQSYEAKGWSVTLRTLGNRDHVALTLVGRQLLIYQVTFTDETGIPQVIIRSTSRCTAPPAAPASAPTAPLRTRRAGRAAAQLARSRMPGFSRAVSGTARHSWGLRTDRRLPGGCPKARRLLTQTTPTPGHLAEISNLSERALKK